MSKHAGSFNISVIGSFNVDMVTRTDRVPEAGETVLANSFTTGLGGKGANQAVAARRLSPDNASVKFVGAVGDGSFGQEFIEAFKKEHIDTSSIKVFKDVSSGTAVILVDERSGQNRILVAPGANDKVTGDEEWVSTKEDEYFAGYGDIAMFQLETPFEAVMSHVERASSQGALVILNPSPARQLPEYVLKSISCLVMNETEATLLSGHSLPIEGENYNIPQLLPHLDSLSKSFIEKGVSTVIITLGASGSYFITRSDIKDGKVGEHVPAHPAKVVDTTAAGDTFVGAFAASLGQSLRTETDKSADLSHDRLLEAVRYGSKAAAKTVEKKGAQSSIPFLKDLSADHS